MNLVHLIGALGCLALTGGFAGQGEIPRAVFYGLCTMAFAIAFAHRVTHRPAGGGEPKVVDVRDTTPALGKVARPH